MNEELSLPQLGATRLNRREVIVGTTAGAAALLTASASGQASAMGAHSTLFPAIDTHIHLFDPTRPQGAPYRGPENAVTYETGAFPSGYAQIAEPLGVVGAIAVEASPWLEDNLWLLETAERDEIMVGVIGNLDLTAHDFGEVFSRFALNPLFRGIRSGNLWGRNLLSRLSNPEVMNSLALVEQAGRVFETANPSIDLLEAVSRIGDALPSMTIVIDHFPRFYPAGEERQQYNFLIKGLASRPKTFVKLSGGPDTFPYISGSHIPNYYERLEEITDHWGADRLLFGTDWPNIEKNIPVEQAVEMIRRFFNKRTPRDQEAFYWRNALVAYQYQPRSDAQKALFAA